MGMKEIDTSMEILDIVEAKHLDKNKNLSVFSELGNNKVLVKYNSDIPSNIKTLYKNLKTDLKIKKGSKKAYLRELEFYKKKESLQLFTLLQLYQPILEYLLMIIKILKVILV